MGMTVAGIHRTFTEVFHSGRGGPLRISRGRAAGVLGTETQTHGRRAGPETRRVCMCTVTLRHPRDRQPGTRTVGGSPSGLWLQPTPCPPQSLPGGSGVLPGDRGHHQDGTHRRESISHEQRRQPPVREGLVHLPRLGAWGSRMWYLLPRQAWRLRSRMIGLGRDGPCPAPSILPQGSQRTSRSGVLTPASSLSSHLPVTPTGPMCFQQAPPECL